MSAALVAVFLLSRDTQLSVDDAIARIEKEDTNRARFERAGRLLRNLSSDEVVARLGDVLAPQRLSDAERLIVTFVYRSGENRLEKTVLAIAEEFDCDTGDGSLVVLYAAQLLFENGIDVCAPTGEDTD